MIEDLKSRARTPSVLSLLCHAASIASGVILVVGIFILGISSTTLLFLVVITLLLAFAGLQFHLAATRFRAAAVIREELK